MPDDDKAHRLNRRLKAEGLGVVKLRGLKRRPVRVTKRQMETRQMDVRRRETYAADMAAYLARPETCEIVKPPRQEGRSANGHSNRCLCLACAQLRQP
jgi:hypothetical protein